MDSSKDKITKELIDKLIYVADFGEPVAKGNAQTRLLDVYDRLSDPNKRISGISIEKIAGEGVTPEIKERAAIILVNEIFPSIARMVGWEVVQSHSEGFAPGYEPGFKIDMDSCEKFKLYLNALQNPAAARKLAGEKLVELLCKRGRIDAVIALSEDAPLPEIKQLAAEALSDTVRNNMGFLAEKEVGIGYAHWERNVGNWGNTVSGANPIYFLGDCFGMVKFANDPHLNAEQKNIIGNAIIETISRFFLNPEKTTYSRHPNEGMYQVYHGKEYAELLQRAADLISEICDGKVKGITEQTIKKARGAVAEIGAKTQFKQITFKVGQDVLRVGSVAEKAARLAKDLQLDVPSFARRPVPGQKLSGGPATVRA